VHWAPRNVASFLISRAVKLVRCLLGIERFFAYADPERVNMAGLSCGWHYLGQGLHGQRGERRQRQYVLPPGYDPRKAN